MRCAAFSFPLREYWVDFIYATYAGILFMIKRKKRRTKSYVYAS